MWPRAWQVAAHAVLANDAGALPKRLRTHSSNSSTAVWYGTVPQDLSTSTNAIYVEQYHNTRSTWYLKKFVSTIVAQWFGRGMLYGPCMKVLQILFSSMLNGRYHIVHIPYLHKIVPYCVALSEVCKFYGIFCRPPPAPPLQPWQGPVDWNVLFFCHKKKVVYLFWKGRLMSCDHQNIRDHQIFRIQYWFRVQHFLHTLLNLLKNLNIYSAWYY